MVDKVLVATIYEADVPNANGIIFPKEELERAVQQFNEQERVITFSPAYPVDDSTLSQAIGTAYLTMEEGVVKAHIKIFNDDLEQELLDNCGKCVPTALGNLDNSVISEMKIVELSATYVDVGVDTDKFWFTEE